MQSGTYRRKAPKGSVQIKSSNERLQLVFSFGGKRHYLSLGLLDTPTNRKVAEAKARQIELDILSDNFDSTLAKYRPKSTLSALTPTVTPIATKFSLTPYELWERYTQHKAPELKETTRQYHANIGKLFMKLGSVPVLDALRGKTGLE
jgi:integrase